MKSFLVRLSNMGWEFRLGIKTRGVIQVNHGDAEHYATLSYRSVFAILERMGLKASDVLVDVGCGRGRVVCCAARAGVKEAIGVELTEVLSRSAEQNALALRGRLSPIRVVNLPAQEFDYAGVTAAYLFNPFGPGTLEAVLRRMAESWKGSPREIRLAYVNPMHHEVFERQEWLTPAGRLDNVDGAFPVTFWKSRGARVEGSR